MARGHRGLTGVGCGQLLLPMRAALDLRPAEPWQIIAAGTRLDAATTGAATRSYASLWAEVRARALGGSGTAARTGQRAAAVPSA